MRTLKANSSSIESAITFYHQLLEHMSDGQLRAMEEQFRQSLISEKASYGGRLLTRYLRPKFLNIAQMMEVREVCTVLRNVTVKAKDAFFANEQVREDIALTTEESALAAISPGFERICVTSRWDSFWGEDGLKFVELNAECPAGVAYSDVMGHIYMDLPVMREFKKKYRVEQFYVREILLHAMLVTYLYWHGNKSTRRVPNIAIVDWKDVPTYTEFELLKEYFEFHGVPTTIADPRELEYRNGRLWSGDFEIDLVYRRVLVQEFIDKSDEVQPMLNAYREGNVCVINSFRTKIVHKKSLFAVLSDTKYAHYFTPYELEIIGRHIPWTRVLREGKTEVKGRPVDLMEYASTNKENLVIKPNDEYGGKGVLIGWEASQEEWDTALKDSSGEPMVVQEKVPLPWEAFPFFDGGLKYEELLVDFDPYLFGVNVGGCLTRLSSSSLANVTAGGGATVSFVIKNIYS